jgi:hypothetical protein
MSLGRGTKPNYLPYSRPMRKPFNSFNCMFLKSGIVTAIDILRVRRVCCPGCCFVVATGVRY